MLTAKACAARGIAPRAVGASRRCPAPRPSVLAPVRAGNSDAVSGEWPVTWSLASYEDVGAFFQKNVFQDTAAPDTKLSSVMSTNLIVATPDMKLSDARSLFDEVTGVPVVRSKTDRTLIGILSRKDIKERGGTYVADVMSREPVACPPTARVADAAGLMLKKKIHRIPIVDPETKVVVGIVTRTDIFTVMLKNGAPSA